MAKGDPLLVGPMPRVPLAPPPPPPTHYTHLRSDPGAYRPACLKLEFPRENRTHLVEKTMPLIMMCLGQMPSDFPGGIPALYRSPCEFWTILRVKGAPYLDSLSQIGSFSAGANQNVG